MISENNDQANVESIVNYKVVFLTNDNTKFKKPKIRKWQSQAPNALGFSINLRQMLT